MKKLFLFLFMLAPLVAQAQLARTLTDSVEVRDRPRFSAEIIMYLPSGTVLNVERLSGRAGEIYVNSDLGYLMLKDIGFISVSKSGETSTSHAQYVGELMVKPPSELTQEEIMYLMLNEMRNQEHAHRDLKQLKNAQVFVAVITGIVAIGSGIVLLSASK